MCNTYDSCTNGPAAGPAQLYVRLRLRLRLPLLGASDPLLGASGQRRPHPCKAPISRGGLFHMCTMLDVRRNLGRAWDDAYPPPL